MGSIISFIDTFDKNFSGKIHNMKNSQWMEYCLIIPVNIFQPYLFPIAIAF